MNELLVPTAEVFTGEISAPAHFRFRNFLVSEQLQTRINVSSFFASESRRSFKLSVEMYELIQEAAGTYWLLLRLRTALLVPLASLAILRTTDGNATASRMGRCSGGRGRGGYHVVSWNNTDVRARLGLVTFLVSEHGLKPTTSGIICVCVCVGKSDQWCFFLFHAERSQVKGPSPLQSWC